MMTFPDEDIGDSIQILILRAIKKNTMGKACWEIEIPAQFQFSLC